MSALCPMTDDGRHKRKPWADFVPLNGSKIVSHRRSGFSCVKCHKTWTWHDGSLIESPWPRLAA